jgi:plastocyanin
MSSMRLALLGAAVVGLSGCGAETMVSAPPPPPVAAAAAADPAAKPHPRTASVRVVNFAYRAKALRVRPGTEVTWTNGDAANHTITFTTGTPSEIANLRPGDSASRRFTRPGHYPYICTLHPFMQATVIVER